MHPVLRSLIAAAALFVLSGQSMAEQKVQPLNDDHYDAAGDFHEGLAAVKKNNKWGFIDTSGKMVIAPQFNPYQAQFNSYFSDGLVAINMVSAQKSGIDGNDPAATRWGFADHTGKIVIAPHFEGSYYRPPHFSEGMAAIAGTYVGTTIKTFGIHTKYGYINKHGVMVVQQLYDEAWDFAEGLAAVKINGKYGFIDQTGKMVIAPTYDGGGFFHNGVAVVELNKQGLVIDRNNKRVLDKTFSNLSAFSDGMARFEDNLQVGFIDEKGNVKIKPTFTVDSDDAERRMFFSEGLCPFQTGTIAGVAGGTRILKKFGYIDKTGKVIIKPQFDYAGQFIDGIAVVSTGGNYGYIDKHGNYVIEPKFANVGNFINGIARVSGGGEFGDYKFRFIRLVAH